MTDVVDDQDLLIRVTAGGGTGADQYEAGGTAGQLILTDVTFGGERDNTLYYGIGNDEPQDHSEGNKAYTLSTENILEERAAEMLRAVIEGDAVSETAMIQAGDVLQATIGTIVWNDWEFSASEDGEVTVTIDADCYDVDLHTDV